MGRNLFVDFAKVAMAFMVLAIHTGFLSEVNGPIEHLLDQGLFRIAVPLFFIFNGYYLGRDIDDSRGTFTLIKRVLLLYGFWMLVYAPFYWYVEGASLFASFKNILRNFIAGYFQMWYLIGMVYALVLLWLLRKLPVALLVTVAMLLLLGGVALQYLNAYTAANLPVSYYRNGILFGFPFMVAGYLVRRYGEQVATKTAVYALLIGLTLLMAESLLSYYYSRPHFGFDLYLSLIVAAPAAALLLVRTERKIKTDRTAKLSTEMYLIHPLMIAVAVAVFHLPRSGTALFLVASLLSLLAFVPIYYLSRKIRFIL